MSTLGIYFGPKRISLVESDGKKLKASVPIPMSQITDSNELEAKVPESVKIATAIKDEIRKNAIEAKAATIVLPGKDLIIRSFHMPILAPQELANAVRFEAKKYIPFKIEDLVSDYQVKLDVAMRKNFVLFVGVKKDVLDKYIAITTQLGLKLESVEYAGFGILRFLSLGKIKEKGVVTVINCDLTEEDEVNFVVLEDGFPLFSRDITLSGEAPLDSLATVKPSGPTESLEKLRIELRISLDFYLRKFPTKNIQRVALIAPNEYRTELEGFIKERGLTPQFIQCDRLIDRPIVFSSGFLKSYASSIGKTVKGPVSVDLLPEKTQKKSQPSSGLASLTSLPFLSLIKIDFKMVILGACIVGAPYLLHYYQKQPLEQQLSVTKSSRPKVAAVTDPEMDMSALEGLDAGYKDKIKVVQKLLQNRLLMTPSFNTIPRAAEKGLWLTNVSLQSEGKTYVLMLSGCVYLGDSEKEVGLVNQFISNLKDSPEFNQLFGNVNVLSVDQGQVDKTLITNFQDSLQEPVMDANVFLITIKDKLISAIIIVVCGIVAFNVYTKNQAELASFTQTNELEKKRNTMLEEIGGLEKNFQTLKKQINNKAINSVIYSLTSLAKESDVKIQYVRPVGEQSQPIYSRYPFELAVSSTDYHKLGKFVSKLENLPEFYSVDNFDITVNEDQLNMRLSVSTVLIR